MAEGDILGHAPEVSRAPRLSRPCHGPLSPALGALCPLRPRDAPELPQRPQLTRARGQDGRRRLTPPAPPALIKDGLPVPLGPPGFLPSPDMAAPPRPPLARRRGGHVECGRIPSCRAGGAAGSGRRAVVDNMAAAGAAAGGRGGGSGGGGRAQQPHS